MGTKRYRDCIATENPPTYRTPTHSFLLPPASASGRPSAAHTFYLEVKEELRVKEQVRKISLGIDAAPNNKGPARFGAAGGATGTEASSQPPQRARKRNRWGPSPGEDAASPAVAAAAAVTAAAMAAPVVPVVPGGKAEVWYAGHEGLRRALMISLRRPTDTDDARARFPPRPTCAGDDGVPPHGDG